MIEPGQECFVKAHGRVYRAVVRVAKPHEVWLKTPAAKAYCRHWDHITFLLPTFRGLLDKEARAIFPQTLAEWAELGEWADTGRVDAHLMPSKALAPERPKAEPRSQPAKPDSLPHYRMPYADNDDDKTVMSFVPKPVFMSCRRVTRRVKRFSKPTHSHAHKIEMQSMP